MKKKKTSQPNRLNNTVSRHLSSSVSVEKLEQKSLKKKLEQKSLKKNLNRTVLKKREQKSLKNLEQNSFKKRRTEEF